MEKRRVLVTGAAGYIAGLLLPALRERYDLTLVDVHDADRQGDRIEGITVADLRGSDPDAHRHLFQGIDTVVHCAYAGFRQGSPGYEAERESLDLTHLVLQHALEEGVRRVVVASSNHAADWYETLIQKRALEMVSPDTPPRAAGFYGWGKIACESLAFLYANGAFGRKLEVVQVRIGAPREQDRSRQDGRGLKRFLGAYISQRDLQQLFARCIETERIDDEHGVPFQIFYGISDNTRAFWSLANARRVIGYAPEDDSEVKFAEEIARWLTGPNAPGRVQPGRNGS